jgi:hypothetical protein
MDPAFPDSHDDVVLAFPWLVPVIAVPFDVPDEEMPLMRSGCKTTSQSLGPKRIPHIPPNAKSTPAQYVTKPASTEMDERKKLVMTPANKQKVILYVCGGQDP